MPCAQLDTRVIDMAARTKPRGLDLDSWTCPLFDYSTFRLENSPEKKNDGEAACKHLSSQVS